MQTQHENNIFLRTCVRNIHVQASVQPLGRCAYAMQMSFYLVFNEEQQEGIGRDMN